MKWSDLDSGTRSSMSQPELIQFAKDAGMVVIEADDHTLLIDIDSEAEFVLFKDRIDDLDELTDSTFIIKPSASEGEHRYIKVKMKKPFPPAERLFLQLYLGSHARREFLSFKRYCTGDGPYILLVRDDDMD
ncbi:hypothetical protein LCGC14_0475880 [marine sediment metagenome]|uniref:Uncharacterized protein n=1 Tax=marine sediment metagenome TaxID=412755 RepID=A0A0F9UXQ9_9ZZZZ